MSQDRIVVILNPKSGSTDGELRGQIEEALGAKNLDFEIRETTPEVGAAELGRAARKEKIAHVIACGGDGTIMGVINGLGANSSGETPVMLTVVPGGTANLFAKSLGIPDEPVEALSLAWEGVAQEVDLGQWDDSLFALGIGVGVTERFISETSDSEKDKFGPIAYVMALLKEVGAPPSTFSLCVDGGEVKEFSGVAIVVANVGEFAGIKIAEGARANDGMLNVCVLHRFEMRDLFRLGWRAVTGRLSNDRKLTVLRAKSVDVSTTPAMDAQIDGEPGDLKTPVKAVVIPRAIRVNLPRASETD